MHINKALISSFWGALLLEYDFFSAMISIIHLYYYFNADWGPKIDVVGFCFLDLASNYEPPEALVKWLQAGEQPVYVGFGSLVSSIS